MTGTSWPTAEPITTRRLHLEPLRNDHATEAFAVLHDPRLHTWTGGRPPASVDELETQYQRQSPGQSPDGTRGWLNWISRRRDDQRVLGTTQATLRRDETGTVEAELAWVIGVQYQRHGYGREAALGMAHWLRQHAVHTLIAHIHPRHTASQGIARTLGLIPTNIVVEGETRWTNTGNTPSTASG